MPSSNQFLRMNPSLAPARPGRYRIYRNVSQTAANGDYDFYDEETSLARSRERDAGWKAEGLVIDHHANRNMPAFQLYFAEAQPIERADIVIDNRDPSAPEIVNPTDR